MAIPIRLHNDVEIGKTPEGGCDRPSEYHWIGDATTEISVAFMCGVISHNYKASAISAQQKKITRLDILFSLIAKQSSASGF